ncbi:Unknown protein, partial [Striga hermonthica]
PVDLKGGLFLCWSDNVSIVDIISSCFGLEVCFMLPNNPNKFWAVFVYASNCGKERDAQWQAIKRHSMLWGDKWFLGGDFNDLVSNEEKRGGKVRSESSFRSFRNFIWGLKVQNIGFKGYPYTWSNNRNGEGFVEERLDRFLFSDEWLLSFPLTTTTHIPRISSDHCLLLMDTNPGSGQRKKRFYFDARWPRKNGFQEAVTEAWQKQVYGPPLYSIQSKIRNTRMALLKWKTSQATNSALLIDSYNAQLAVMLNQGSRKDWDNWMEIKKKLQKAYLEEEEYWRQKSRIQWLKNGDKNTRYFHTCVKHRRIKNKIAYLMKDNGESCGEEKEIVEEIVNSFQKIFTSTEHRVEECSLEGMQRVINLSKSSIFFSKNTSNDSKDYICQLFGGIQVVRSSKYLGMPLGIGKSKLDTFKFV